MTRPGWRVLRPGLRGRFLWLLALAVLLASGVLGVAWQQQRTGFDALTSLNQQAMREVSVNGVRRRGEAIASLLGEALTNPLYYFDLQSIGEIARSALAQPDVAYVLVFDAQGRVIHDGSGDIPAFGQPMSDPFAYEAVHAERLHTQRSGNRVDVARPIRIGDEKLGGVRIGLLLDGQAALEAQSQAVLRQRADRTGRDSLQLLALLFSSFLLIGALLSLLVSRGLVQPIRRLADAARAIESGRYRIALPGSRNDEMGELERAFERMGDAVARHDEQIRRIAYTDSLTGLPNRVAFREDLDRRLVVAQAAGTELALLFVDLDDFKRINDTLGHDAGDEVLEQFALRLRHCLSLVDDREAGVARFGGDEFVALFEGRSVRDAARSLAEAILVELQRPMTVRGRQVFLGASVGITEYPADAIEARSLLKNGDIAMYQAKSAGKNCVRFYSRAMDLAVEQRMRVEQDLRGAWERGELSLSFQPIYELANGRLVGAEALLRWKHPELGEIQPSAFVEIAEQSGLIDVIGRHVLRHACAAASRWPTDEVAPFVSVNVSARQLRTGDLPEQVAEVLRDTGLLAERLHIELTETAVLGDELQAGALLARLRAMGVKIWLDDFGTGFSGLSHLRRVPVDGLKIDKSFIADVLRDPDDLALTTAIIAMAHSLGITVVAEGVETEAQFSLLRERGCDQAQGFWLGRPMLDADLSERMGG